MSVVECKELSEAEAAEWLNADVPCQMCFRRTVIYYPDGIIRKYEGGTVFDNRNPGDREWSGFVGWVIVAEKSGDGKRIWLEKA